MLASGALPIRLKLISSQQVSATLGQQALNQGLVAGLVGFAVVALFLLVFYRVLGVIAVAALAIYALYFYALIKLIPVTLTLPGIAGLILTIGVAADANVVIFERVKEESRAGRSSSGAIVDRLPARLRGDHRRQRRHFMTAFILFVLATPGSRASRSRSASACSSRCSPRSRRRGRSSGRWAASRADLARAGARRARQRPALDASTSWAPRAGSSRCRA